MKFGYTGQSQAFTAEKDKKYTIDLYGAQGGWASGGLGGHTNVVYSPTANTTLNFYVGGQGSPSGEGGYNGGGAGGKGYNGDYTGEGGGGATDVRTGTALSTRIIVAGGGGGEGTWWRGGHGGEYPYNDSGDIEWNNGVSYYYCGGGEAGATFGGVGGTAPVWTTDGYYTNDGTYYPHCGGGGGGGYYGGGGGSTGIIEGASNYTGVAGSTGSLGNGGAGGGKTTGVSGYNSKPAGGGGGGSSYVNTSNSGILSYCCNTGRSSNDGEAYIHEILGKPIIEKIEKEGSNIKVTISKDTLGNGVEEVFYYDWSTGSNNFDIDRDKFIIINNTPHIYTSFLSSTTTVGYRTIYFKVCSGLGETVEASYTFYDGQEDNLVYNLENKKILQGHFLTDFITDLTTEKVDRKFETKIVINGKQYGNCQEGNQIYLPLLYDGYSENETYDLQLFSRVGKLLSSENGVKKYQWSSWISSDVIEVESTIAPYNNLYFTSLNENQIVEADSVFNLSWKGSENKQDNIQYIIELYKDGEKIQDLYKGYETNIGIIANFPSNAEYQFGLSLIKDDKFKSITTFSEKFKVVSIRSGENINISNDLKLTTSLENEFIKISILINNEHHKTLGNNVQNEQLPLWKMKKSTNLVAIKVYSDEKYYVEQTFQVALHVSDDTITPINQYNVDLYCSIHDDNNYTLMIPNELKQYKWGEIEEEHNFNIEEKKTIEEINQKITIRKIDSSKVNSFKGIQLLGQID